MSIKWNAGRTWVEDDNGNKCSVQFFGSEEAAEKALASLKNCKRCSDCSYCSECSDCSDCSYCSECSHCSYCSYCSDCSYCSGCSHCSDCSYCSGCSHCSECSECSSQNDSKGWAVRIPSIPDLHAKVYAAASQPGALDMREWHACGTTHCWAGWIVHLAGEAGYALEAHHNTELAAMLIARESGAAISPARFYDTDAEALEEMKRMANA